MLALARFSVFHVGYARISVLQSKPGSAVGSASDLRARGPGRDTRSGHIHLSPVLLIQEGQLSVTGKNM